MADEQDRLRRLRQLSANATPVSPAVDPYYVRDPKTGLSPAQVDAKAAQAAAKVDTTAIAKLTGATINPETGMLVPPIIKKTGNNTGDNTPTNTNVDVLKAVLIGMGFDSNIIDSSVSFLKNLLDDGLDYDNAVAVFLNTKEYTFKDGKKISSPFYAEYGFLNEGLIKPKTPAELYNAVQGYKGVMDKYGLSSKFTSKDSLKKYVKNNVSVEKLDERANMARLKGINADPAYTDALKALGYITNPTDLTDFFMDPTIGEEQLNERRSTAALTTEAVRRAKQYGIMVDTSRMSQLTAGLLGKGLSEAQIGTLGAEAYQTIGEQLQPLTMLSGAFEKGGAASASQIQSELESEQLLGMASERRKRLTQMNVDIFSGRSGRYQAKSSTAGLV